MVAAVAGSANAHRVDTDLTGENVRSNPAIAVVCGRDNYAIRPASSRASTGSRPNSARKNSRPTWVRIAARSLAATADRLGDSEATPQQYLLLVGGLRTLSLATHAARSVLDSYLLRAMALSGWAPSLEDCARCGAPGPHDGFVAQLGGTVCSSCAPVGSARIRPETRALLRALIAGEWESVDAAPDATSAAASGLVAAYSQYHLERGIRSLSHVENLR